MSVGIAPHDLKETLTRGGERVVHASIVTLVDTFDVSPLTAAHVVLRQSLMALHLLGGDQAANFAVAAARLLKADMRGDDEAVRAAENAEMRAFEKMAAAYDAQVERMNAGGLQ
jgi:hypothetical protein